MPGYETGVSVCVQDVDRGFNRDGSKSVFGSETDLVINNLFERTTLVEQGVKLDDVRVLMSSHVSMAVREEGIKGDGLFRRIDWRFRQNRGRLLWAGRLSSRWTWWEGASLGAVGRRRPTFITCLRGHHSIETVTRATVTHQ